MSRLPTCWKLSDISDLHEFARSTAPSQEKQRLSCSDYRVVDGHRARFVLPPAASLLTSAVHQRLEPTGTAQLAQLSSAHWNEPTLLSSLQGKVMVLIEAIETFQLNHWTWVQASGDQHQGEEARESCYKIGIFFFFRQSEVVIQLVPVWIQNSHSLTVRPSFPLFIRAIKQ